MVLQRSGYKPIETLNPAKPLPTQIFTIGNQGLDQQEAEKWYTDNILLARALALEMMIETEQVIWDIPALAEQFAAEKENGQWIPGLSFAYWLQLTRFPWALMLDKLASLDRKIVADANHDMERGELQPSNEVEALQTRIGSGAETTSASLDPKLDADNKDHLNVDNPDRADLTKLVTDKVAADRAHWQKILLVPDHPVPTTVSTIPLGHVMTTLIEYKDDVVMTTIPLEHVKLDMVQVHSDASRNGCGTTLLAMCTGVCTHPAYIVYNSDLGPPRQVTLPQLDHILYGQRVSPRLFQAKQYITVRGDPRIDTWAAVKPAIAAAIAPTVLLSHGIGSGPDNDRVPDLVSDSDSDSDNPAFIHDELRAASSRRKRLRALMDSGATATCIRDVIPGW